MKKLSAIVIGATGATGQELVKLLLKDSNFIKVKIFVRRNPSIQNVKLYTYEIDFSRLNNYKKLINGDVLFSALGTTLNQAGSKKEQYLVDYDYQYEFARIASQNKIPCYSLVSTVGANKSSHFFYPRTKGELEEEIKKLGFKKTYIFQPPFLIRQPNLIRPGERKVLKILKVLNKVGLLKSQKPLPVKLLAQKMIDEIKSDKKSGLKVYKPKDIF